MQPGDFQPLGRSLESRLLYLSVNAQVTFKSVCDNNKFFNRLWSEVKFLLTTFNTSFSVVKGLLKLPTVLQ